MKKMLRSILFVSFIACVIPLITPGCKTPPDQRGQAVTTLKIVGASVDATMKLGAQLLYDKQITRAQWDQIAVIHDTQFQPAYNLAVAAVQANLDSVASPELIGLASQLASAIVSFQNQNKSL